MEPAEISELDVLEALTLTLAGRQSWGSCSLPSVELTNYLDPPSTLY